MTGAPAGRRRSGPGRGVHAVLRDRLEPAGWTYSVSSSGTRRCWEEPVRAGLPHPRSVQLDGKPDDPALLVSACNGTDRLALRVCNPVDAERVVRTLTLWRVLPARTGGGGRA